MTKRISPHIFLIVAVSIGIPSLTNADLLDITDGNSRFMWDPDDGTSFLGSVNGFAGGFDPVTNVNGYAPAEIPMIRYREPAANLITHTMADQGVIVTNSANSAGSTGTAHVDIGYLSPRGGFTDFFDVDFTFSISSGPRGNPILNYSMTLTNISGEGRPEVELFSYWDWDLDTNQNSVVDFSAGGFTGFLQKSSTLSSGPPDYANAFRGTDNFESWEVDDWDNIETKLLAGGSLNNSGTPYAVADATAAFGWNLGTMSAGESFTVNMFINTIPEPGMAQFFGCISMLIAGLCIYRKRR